MTAIIDGITVNGTPSEINDLINLRGGKGGNSNWGRIDKTYPAPMSPMPEFPKTDKDLLKLGDVPNNLYAPTCAAPRDSSDYCGPSGESHMEKKILMEGSDSK